MAALVLTVIGDDRAGLVHAVAEAISEHGGNWERSQMSELAGKFAGIVLVTVPDAQVESLIASLEPLHGLLDVTVQIAPDGGEHDSMVRLTLDLVGTDRPGIVNDITSVLSDHQVNIESLTTETKHAPMAGGVLFEAKAELEVPSGADLEALKEALEDLANELMVDIELDATLL
jgi:glycine cleavage system regulatory protein